MVKVLTLLLPSFCLIHVLSLLPKDLLLLSLFYTSNLLELLSRVCSLDWIALVLKLNLRFGTFKVSQLLEPLKLIS